MIRGIPSLDDLRAYVRAADYLAAIQIFLRDNVLLERPLSFEDIKPRLLGHWGTCPGINMVYAHANRAIIEHDLDALFVLGPGHGFPALQANLFLERSLGEVDSKAAHTLEGITYVAKQFSWPYGFPSHSNPEAPGVIVEGGELGYALGTAYGAVLDNPGLLAVCVVGDGEAETGPTAAAWHAHRIIDPATSGLLLPVLHLNGYKISGPTFFGRMENDELRDLWRGYGYEPIIVESDDPHEALRDAFDAALTTGRHRQRLARERRDFMEVHPPMIILKTPKGRGGIKTLRDKKIEGNHYAHQTVLKNAGSDLLELHALEDWLRSYAFGELFSARDGFSEAVVRAVPPLNRCMGMSPHARGGGYRPLELPSPAQFSEPLEHPGIIGSSSMRRVGSYLNEVFIRNAATANVRFFSPDETYSNKLDAIFQTTARAWAGRMESFDEDLAQDGRVHEMLSEHTLQAMMQGYVLSGRHGVFASYEAFIQIIASMVDQYAKFLRVAEGVPWRGPVPSLNYILTSSGWRQEHNGFSHQNPGFIDDMLQRQGCAVNVYFPADGNTALAVMHRALGSVNGINIIVAGKTLEPRWRTPEEAVRDVAAGMAVWEFASDENPHVVVASAGDYVTKEALAAISIVKHARPEVRIRYVNMLTLSAIAVGERTCALSQSRFEELFTTIAPVVINFHGYPQTIKQILFDYGASTARFTVRGYIEQGSTTTPFDMHVRNGTSRYHLAKAIALRAHERGAIDEVSARRIGEECDAVVKKHDAHVRAYGVDMEEIENWTWPHTT